MKYTVLFLLFLFTCFAHANAKHLHKSQYVVIPYDASDARMNRFATSRFPTGSVATSLTEKEIETIEPLFEESIERYNAGQENIYERIHAKHSDVKRGDFIIDAGKYKRQYIAVVTPTGEKLVWINCFCDTNGNWKKDIVEMLDGGNCFFNVMINLTKGKYYNFSVNGVG